MNKLKIEMIHDVVCSWCPIGYANLNKAVKNLALDVDLKFLPFELNPDIQAEESIKEHLKQRNGWSDDNYRDYIENLITVAKQAGVVMDFSKRTHYYNTHNAHRLIHWSESFNGQQTLNESLIKAYFEQGLDISNTQTLLNIAEQLGWDTSQAAKALVSSEIAQQLTVKKQRVLEAGITAVPAFIFNNQTLITGSNSVEYFQRALLETNATH